ncbi:MAG: FAD-binding protein [Sphingobacteriales bacterium]|nr:MAG: FAD-binding protein [Sphingobacteriales bacterium]
MNKPDMDPTYFDVVIIGGGLAGLIASIELGRAGCKVALIEKKQYPFHKVCGEYVSNEVLPYLKQTGFDPHRFGASSISRLLVTAPNGRRFFAPLQSGGFGISRFRMDNHLVQLTREAGVHVMEGTRVMNAAFLHNQFELTLNNGSVIQCGLALGCYGKRDSLDKKLDRGFINKRTGYLGVKYHIHADLPADEIALHNFKGGYCGVVKIEDDKFNLCYLRKAAGNSKPQSLDELEATVLAVPPPAAEAAVMAATVAPRWALAGEVIPDMWANLGESSDRWSRSRATLIRRHAAPGLGGRAVWARHESSLGRRFERDGGSRRCH